MNDVQLANLQERLNYRFSDTALLINAMTHSSYANETLKNGNRSNERLEFIGDSLLGMSVALLIYNNKPDLMEGQMTKLRAELVCERNLFSQATKLDLGPYLLLSRGEENGGGRSRPSILADAFEAIIAAIYLDGGFDPVRKFVSECFEKEIDRPMQGNSDYKTLLQEMIQVNPGQTLVYKLTGEQGPTMIKHSLLRFISMIYLLATARERAKRVLNRLQQKQH